MVFRSTHHPKEKPVMRTTVPALAILGLAAAGVLTAAPSTAAPALDRTAPTSSSSAEIERGVVLECTGSAHGTSAYVDLYENDRYVNYVQVVVNDDPELANSREPADLWRAGKVRTAIRVGGERAVVSGTAVRVGRPKRVHEEHDDAGQHIVVDGTHRRLRSDLVLTYAGTRIPLTCDTAFAYRLRVTKTDATNG